MVTAISWSPGAVANGQPVTFSATVQNRGSAPTPAGVVHGVGFQVDGTLRTWADRNTDSLAPGQSVTVTAVGGPTGSPTWTVITGTHQVLAYVDDAQRIAESDEGNNRTAVTVTVAAKSTVTTTTLVGAVPTTTLVPLAQKTGLATSVTGSAYASCVSYDAAGREVSRPGTEKYIGEYGAGNTQYHQNASYSWSGVGDAAVGVTKVTSSAVDATEIRKWNYGTPPQRMTCRTGEYATFTRLHATKVTTNRYAIAADGYSQGALLGVYAGPVNTDIKIGY